MPNSAGRGVAPAPTRLPLLVAALALWAVFGIYRPVLAAAEPQPTPRLKLVFYWGVDCPHCEAAKPFVASLASQYPNLDIERIEVRRDAEGRSRFVAHMNQLGLSAAGVPTFVIGERAIVGFRPGQTEAAVREAIEEQGGAAGQPRSSPIDLPVFGRIDPAAVPFGWFTVLVGLADGLNPCAFWVLTVMLSLLLRVRSRRRLLLFGGLFVAMSGIVYFLFMTAWTLVFLLIGMSAQLTRVLGAGLLVMGLINLKELIWFKRGPSLMIPDSAKSGLYERMRSIAGAASLPAAVLGIAALAFVVNLVELGCTLGLPAMYTRVLSLQSGLGSAERYAYLALYNVAYVVPLGLIVTVYAVTFHRFTLTERGAKLLKAISGALLTIFGVTFLLGAGLLG